MKKWPTYVALAGAVVFWAIDIKVTGNMIEFRNFKGATRNSGLGTSPMPVWVKLASLDDLADSGAFEVAHEGRIIALFQVEGGIRAIDGMCPHQGGPLAEGERAGEVVTCPWHGWQFELAGGRCLNARSVNQRVFETRIVGRDVLVDVP
jgi:nitrite reductase/ring-hydroxylating ferredoxin subunit